MKLIFPTIEYKLAVLDYRQEHVDNNVFHMHGSAGFMSYVEGESYENWLGRVTLAQTDDPDGYVNSTTFLAVIQVKVVGMISIRHYLNDALLNKGGHIGYGVRPSERGKGYATKMLALALEESRTLGIDRVLVTCDKGNIGSAKTILKNGGVLENEITEEDGNVHQRYWIDVI